MVAPAPIRRGYEAQALCSRGDRHCRLRKPIADTRGYIRRGSEVGRPFICVVRLLHVVMLVPGKTGRSELGS